MAHIRSHKVSKRTGRSVSVFKKCLPGVLLVFITLTCYVPAMQGGFIWDDDRYVTDNPVLTSMDGLARIWLEFGSTIQYYPMVFTSFWVERQLWGLNPTGFHVVNILFHALGAVLLWRVLRLLKVPCAWMAAAVFAVHPVHVESVAWITERKNVLSGVFYLSSVLFYICYLRLESSAEPDGSPSDFASKRLNTRDHYILAIMLYICALLSKTVACTMPVIILMILWWKKGRIKLRDCLSLLPFFVLGAAAGMITLYMEKYNVKAQGPEWDFLFLERFLIAGRALWFYVAKLIWPHPLIFNYPKWKIDPAAWWQYLFPAAAGLVILVFYFLRERIGKSVLVAVLFFVITLFPALGFFNVYPMRYSFVADHFQYLASIGLITLLVSAGGIRLTRHVPKPIVFCAAALVLLLFGTLVWHQSGAYRNLETIWRDTLAKNPDSWMAYNNLGTTVADQGNFDEAIALYKAALRLKPDHYKAHTNLGNAYIRKGKLDKAEDHYAEAIRIEPKFVAPYIRLGEIRIRQGRINEAVDQLSRVVNKASNSAQARYYLGLALFEKGYVTEAIAHYKKALEIQSDNADIYNVLGVALARQNRLDEAMTHFSKALDIDPDFKEAQYNLKLVMDKAGRKNG